MTEAFHFVRSSSRLDASEFKIDDEKPEETAAAVAYLKSLLPQPVIPQGPVEDCKPETTNLRLDSQFLLRAPEPGLDNALRLVNERFGVEVMTMKTIYPPSRPNLTTWIEIAVRGVLRALVAVRDISDRSGVSKSMFIERGVCFGAHETQVRRGSHLRQEHMTHFLTNVQTNRNTSTSGLSMACTSPSADVSIKSSSINLN